MLDKGKTFVLQCLQVKRTKPNQRSETLNGSTVRPNINNINKFYCLHLPESVKRKLKAMTRQNRYLTYQADAGNKAKYK